MAIASGVVFKVGSNIRGKPLPRVPINAVFFPRAQSDCAIHWLHEVLPLVPVTPITHIFLDGLLYT